MIEVENFQSRDLLAFHDETDRKSYSDQVRGR